MTVQELIDLLNNVKEKSQRVVVNGYEGGYCDVNSIVFTELVLNVHKAWYYGPHDKPEALLEDQEIGMDVVNAIQISSLPKEDK